MVFGKGQKQAVRNDSKGDERGHWKRPLEFVLSSVGYAVGMGSLYRFPYLAMRNGGGAFLIPYLLFAVICGIPLFFMEAALGQYYQRSPLNLFDLCPLFKGVGMSMCLISQLSAIYYIVVISWALYFLGMTFSATLPWTTCGNSWNTNSCIPLIQTDMNLTWNSTGNLLGNYTGNKGILAAEEFWENKVLWISEGIDDIGPINWHLALTLFIGWFAVFICIFKGIASSRIAVYITATIPFFVIAILLCWSVTLPGAVDGILVYIVPRWERMANLQVWVEAFVQVFYSLGPAWGGIITLGSYNPFHLNCLRDSVIVTLADTFTAILCGFVIFSGLGYMAHQRGVPVLEVVNSGPGLSFVTYPQVVATMPFPQFWAALFFLLVFFLGIDSTFGLVKTFASSLFDLYPVMLGQRKALVTFVVCFASFLIGLPFVTRAGMYWFQVVDWYLALFTLMFIAFLETVIISYIYGADRFIKNILEMRPRSPKWIIFAMKISWKYLIPVVMLATLIFAMVTFRSPKYGLYEYPEWTNVFGWILALSSSLPIFGVLVYKLLTTEGLFVERLKKSTEPQIWREGETGPDENGVCLEVLHQPIQNVKYSLEPGYAEEKVELYTNN